MNRQDLEKGLAKYIPPETVSSICELIIELKVHMRVSKQRSWEITVHYTMARVTVFL